MICRYLLTRKDRNQTNKGLSMEDSPFGLPGDLSRHFAVFSFSHLIQLADTLYLVLMSIAVCLPSFVM
jgi:hypothetical protein